MNERMNGWPTAYSTPGTLRPCAHTPGLCDSFIHAGVREQFLSPHCVPAWSGGNLLGASAGALRYRAWAQRGRPNPLGQGCPRQTIRSLLKLCQARLPGPGESGLTRKKAPPLHPRHMQPPGAWLSRKCLCWEEKGPLSLERSSPARTQGLVSGGLLHWVCLYKADFSALHDNPGAALPPSLQSTSYL